GRQSDGDLRSIGCKLARSENACPGNEKANGHGRPDQHGHRRIRIYDTAPAPNALCIRDGHGLELPDVRRLAVLTSFRSSVSSAEHPIRVPDLACKTARSPTDQWQYLFPRIFADALCERQLGNRRNGRYEAPDE